MPGNSQWAGTSRRSDTPQSPRRTHMAVDELEPERDEEGNAQKGQLGRRQAVRGVPEAHGAASPVGGAFTPSNLRFVPEATKADKLVSANLHSATASGGLQSRLDCAFRRRIPTTRTMAPTGP